MSEIKVDTVAEKTSANGVTVDGLNIKDSKLVTANSVVETNLTDNIVTLAKMASGTDGNIISYDASGNPVAIATGNDGQVLTSTGAGSPPAFEAIPGGGKVLQVLTATDQTARTTTSTSFVTASNTLSVDITPSATSSKIFVQASFQAGTDSGARGFWTIYKDSTHLGHNNGMFSVNASNDVAGSLTFLDSPSSTSELTYAVYIKSNGTACHMNADTVKGSIVVMEIGA